MAEHTLQILFRGRFEARFATDPDPSAHLRGLSGWTFALTGEPDFDRVIRLNDPVSQRLPAPRASTHVTGVLRDGVKVADALIGEPVNLGPQTLFFGDAAHPPGREILQAFELHVGRGPAYLSGTCARMPELQSANPISAAERRRYGLDPASVWEAQLHARIAVIAASGVPNASERIAHIKDFANQYRTIRGLDARAPGRLDRALHFTAQDSKAIALLQQNHVKALGFEVRFFNFDGDLLMGNVTGAITAAFATA